MYHQHDAESPYHHEECASDSGEDEQEEDGDSGLSDYGEEQQQPFADGARGSLYADYDGQRNSPLGQRDIFSSGGRATIDASDSEDDADGVRMDNSLLEEIFTDRNDSQEQTTQSSSVLSSQLHSAKPGRLCGGHAAAESRRKALSDASQFAYDIWKTQSTKHRPEGFGYLSQRLKKCHKTAKSHTLFMGNHKETKPAAGRGKRRASSKRICPSIQMESVRTDLRVNVREYVRAWLSETHEGKRCFHCSFAMDNSEVKHPIPLLLGNRRSLLLVGSACSPLCAISFWHVRKNCQALHLLRTILCIMDYGFCYHLQPLDCYELEPLSPQGVNPRDPKLYEQAVLKDNSVMVKYKTNIRTKLSYPFPIAQLQIVDIDGKKRYRKKQSSLQSFFKT